MCPHTVAAAGRPFKYSKQTGHKGEERVVEAGFSFYKIDNSIDKKLN